MFLQIFKGNTYRNNITHSRDHAQFNEYKWRGDYVDDSWIAIPLELEMLLSAIWVTQNNHNHKLGRFYSSDRLKQFVQKYLDSTRAGGRPGRQGVSTCLWSVIDFPHHSQQQVDKYISVSTHYRICLIEYVLLSVSSLFASFHITRSGWMEEAIPNRQLNGNSQLVTHNDQMNSHNHGYNY